MIQDKNSDYFLPGILHPGLESSVQERVLEQVQRRVTKMVRGMQHLSNKDKLRKLGWFNLEKKSLQGDHIVAFQYLKGTYKNEGETLYIGVVIDKREWF